MKTTNLSSLALSFLSLAVITSAQTISTDRDKAKPRRPFPQPRAWEVSERGSSHRVWESTVVERDAQTGKDRYQRRKVVELAGGMHRQNEKGEWVEAGEQVELFQNGAVARQGRHQVLFEANINTPWAIDIQGGDGVRLKTHVLGLAFVDEKTGKSVLIATLQDAAGEVHPPNRVLYRKALLGQGVAAHIRYTYTRNGFAQDVVFTEPLGVTPADYQMDEVTTRLEIWTEMWPSQLPVIEVGRQGSDASDFVFGEMSIVPGRAFLLGKTDEGLPIRKSWEQANGRHYLVESVAYPAIKRQLEGLALDKPQAAVKPHKVLNAPQIVQGRAFPPAPQAPKIHSVMHLALNPLPSQAVVMDYELLYTSTTNLVLEGDRTYWVTGPLVASGQTTIKGGAVVKIAHTNNAGIKLSGMVQCQTDPYQPAVFTVQNDCTLGETVDASSIITNYNVALNVAQTNASLQYLRFKYARNGLMSYGVNLNHSQFVHCQNAVETTGGKATLGNVLFYDIQTVFSGTNYTVAGCHVTANQCGLLGNAYTNTGSSSIALTNSLLVSVTNLGSVCLTTNYTASAASGSGVFQTVGMGASYLSATSSYRDVGTPNIPNALWTALQKKTTYPPQICATGWISTNLVWDRQVARDISLPDLGYHYEPIDYLVDGLVLSNGTAFASNGVVVSCGGDYWHGLLVYSGSSLTSAGTAEKPNRFVGFHTVQEQYSTNWGFTGTDSTVAAGHFDGTLSAPILQCTFTEWNSLASGGQHVTSYMLPQGPHKFNHNQFHSGRFYIETTTMSLFNCLLDQCEMSGWSGDETVVTMTNCTINAYWELFALGVNPWVFKNNLFLSTNNLFYWDTTPYIHGNNAYLANSVRIEPYASNDVILAASSVPFQPGPLGRYYLPMDNPAIDPLFNHGNTNANLLGLYHFTTTTNQVKETNSIVDIGFHYVAVGTNGQVGDTDGDRIPDCFEDANGNGVVDPGETGWQCWDTDYDGISDGMEMQLGTSPTSALSITNVLLGRWRLDGWPFDGDQGQPNRFLVNLPVIAGVSSNAVVSVTNQYCVEGYRHFEQTNGFANLNMRAGTVRFSFKPNWTSGASNSLSFVGRPPVFLSGAGRIWEYAKGCWELGMGNSTTSLVLRTKTNFTWTSDIWEVPVSFQSNTWYQITLTYGPNGVAMYTNGVRILNASTGVRYWPQTESPTAPYFTICGDQVDATDLANGAMDNFETYNYPMTLDQVQNADTDLDGLPDAWERANGLNPLSAADVNMDADSDGLTNLQEYQLGINPQRWDTDYDGVNDGMEVLIGTNPTNASSVTNVLLGRWRLDGWPFDGDQGQPNRFLVNLPVTTGVNSNAVVSVTNQYCVEGYRHFEQTNRVANLNMRSGTVKFWYKPNWTSGASNSLSFVGRPPVFLSGAGRPWITAWGCWELGMGNSTTSLVFSTRTNYGGTCDTWEAPVNFQSNTWYQITLAYGPNGVDMYTNGVQILSATNGVRYWPQTESPTAPYFTICGDQVDATDLANGAMDDLMTYNYPRSTNQVQSDYQAESNNVPFLDTDLDGALNACDADPFNASVGVLNVTIDTPSNGTVVQ